MEGFLLLADAARNHPDGTFSLLRGGIDRVNAAPNQPIFFRGAFIARIVGSLGEAGPHEFRVRLLNEDGQSIFPDVAGGFTIPEQGGATNAVVDFNVILPRYGRYTFFLLVDRQQLATWEVRAEESRQTQAGGGG
jgi:hypothetical protein